MSLAKPLLLLFLSGLFFGGMECFLPQMVRAQGNSLLGYGEDHISNSTIRNANGGQIGIRDQNSNLTIPIPLDIFTILISGTNQIKSLYYQDVGASDILPERLHSTGATLGLVGQLKEDQWVFQGGTTLESDRKDISAEDYVESARFIYIDNDGDSAWQYGLARSTAFGSTSTFPIIGYSSSGSLIDLKVILPVLLNVSAKFNENWQSSLNFAVSGGQYRLTEEAPLDSAILRFSNVKSTWELSYRLWGPLWLSASVGRVSHRVWSLLDKDGDTFHDAEGNKVEPTQLDDGSMKSLALAIQF